MSPLGLKENNRDIYRLLPMDSYRSIVRFEVRANLKLDKSCNLYFPVPLNLGIREFQV
jgi:hypothetical protein